MALVSSALNQPVTVHQFHFSATAGDAVTNHMLLIRQALREGGIGGEIFVGENKAPASYGIQTFSPEKLWASDLIYIHHSHGNPLLENLLRVEIPKALLYHNVTPPEFFAHDPFLAALSSQGRSDLRNLAGKVVAAFGVSKFNVSELGLYGFSKPALFPLLDLEARGPYLAKRAPALTQSRTLLFVGKLTPHKNQALLIQVLFYLEKCFGKRYQLNLVGRKDPIYDAYLKLLAKALGVSNQVHFAGAVSQPALESYYQEAAALVCPSLHEGFCVPVIEAMQRGLPVFSLGIAGLRETLGKSAVRFTSKDPFKIALSIDTVLSSQAACEAIAQGQDLRLEELKKFQNRSNIRTITLDLVEKLRSPRVPARGHRTSAERTT